MSGRVLRWVGMVVAVTGLGACAQGVTDAGTGGNSSGGTASGGQHASGGAGAQGGSDAQGGSGAQTGSGGQGGGGTCGDGIQQAGEGCDDGNAIDTDACPSTCVPASCGDGFVHDGFEECDDSNADDTDACVNGCFDAFCGDGFLHDGFEECDDGGVVNGDGCSDTCTSEGNIHGPIHTFEGLSSSFYITQFGCTNSGGDPAADALWFCQHFYDDPACVAQPGWTEVTSSADPRMHSGTNCNSPDPNGISITGTACIGGPCKIGSYGSTVSGLTDIVCSCP